MANDESEGAMAERQDAAQAQGGGKRPVGSARGESAVRWAAVAGVLTVVLILGFVYVPYARFDSQRWSVGAGLGAILIALVALVLAIQSYVRFSQQLRREESELVGDVVAQIVQVFGPWPGLVMRLHAYAGEILTLGDQVMAHPDEPIDSPADAELICELMDSVSMALDAMLSSSTVQDYLTWSSRQAVAGGNPLATLWSTILERNEVPSDASIRHRFATDQPLAVQLAALRRELEVERLAMKRDPQRATQTRAMCVMAWCGGAGSRYSDLMQSGAVQPGLTTNTLLIGGVLAEGNYYHEYLLNFALLVVFVFWLWPAEADLSRYVQHRFGALFIAGVAPRLDAPDRVAAFGHLAAGEIQVCTDHPEVLLFDLRGFAASRDSI